MFQRTNLSREIGIGSDLTPPLSPWSTTLWCSRRPLGSYWEWTSKGIWLAGIVTLSDQKNHWETWSSIHWKVIVIFLLVEAWAKSISLETFQLSGLLRDWLCGTVMRPLAVYSVHLCFLIHLWNNEIYSHDRFNVFHSWLGWICLWKYKSGFSNNMNS